jgi:hypothetical protein
MRSHPDDKDLLWFLPKKNAVPKTLFGPRSKSVVLQLMRCFITTPFVPAHRPLCTEMSNNKGTQNEVRPPMLSAPHTNPLDILALHRSRFLLLCRVQLARTFESGHHQTSALFSMPSSSTSCPWSLEDWIVKREA